MATLTIDPTAARVEREFAHGSPIVGCRFDPSGRFLFTGGMTAAAVVALCLAVAGVRVHSAAAARRELLAYLTETPRLRESQRV